MSTFTQAERELLRAVSRLTYANPFGEERLEAEERALGRRVRAQGRGGVSLREDNAWEMAVDELQSRTVGLLERRRAIVLRDPGALDPRDAEAWRDAVFTAAFHVMRPELDAHLAAAPSREGRPPSAKGLLEKLTAFTARYLPLGKTAMAKHDAAPEGALVVAPAPFLVPGDVERLLGLFHQLRRAFLLVYHRIAGSSPCMARLRASVWEAIFSNDLRFYTQALAGRLRDFPVLVLGETGTGKELVARALGLSAYIPCDATRQEFATDYRSMFLACNIAQFAETLVESELFGHVKGAYTGAVTDAEGLMKVCPEGGVVFLDEIGELSPTVQVKMLRVLQARMFSPVGSRGQYPFHGRLVTATHRDPAVQIAAGRLREDFVFRLAASVIHLPPLRQRLSEDAAELEDLLQHIARRLASPLDPAGNATQALPSAALGSEAVLQRIASPIALMTKDGYRWPGNVRELEQASRSILLHGCYRPVLAPFDPSPPPDAAAPLPMHRQASQPPGPMGEILGALIDGSLSMRDLQDAYCRHVHQLAGGFQAAGERLGVDWRTVKSAVSRGRIPPASRDGKDRGKGRA